MTIKPEAQIAPMGALGTSANASESSTLTASSAFVNNARLRELAKVAANSKRWVDWCPARLAAIDEQIICSGIVRGCQLHLSVWDAIVEATMIRLAHHQDIKHGAGPLRFWLGLMSFRNTADVEPNEKNPCRVRTTIRNSVTGRPEPGPLAMRCGLDPATVGRYLPFLRDDDDAETGKASENSLKILTVTARWGERQAASDYDWTLDLPSIVMSMAKPNRKDKPADWPFRLNSRIVLAAFLLKRMVRTQGTVCLRRRDLAATGLDVDAAHKVLNWLLANDFFVKVGDGVAALPEMAKAGIYKKVEGGFWDRKPRRLEGHSDQTKTQSGRSIRAVQKVSQNGLGGHSGNGSEGQSAERSGRSDVEQREVLFKQQEGSKPPEALKRLEDSSAALVFRSDLDDLSLLGPSQASDVPSSVATDASTIVFGRDGSGLFADPMAEIAVSMAHVPTNPANAANAHHAEAKKLRDAYPRFRAEVVAAVGLAAPISYRQNEAAITQAVDGMLAAAIKSGLGPNMTIAIIADAAFRLVADGRRFNAWGGDRGGVRRVIDDAIKSRLMTTPTEQQHESRPR